MVRRLAHLAARLAPLVPGLCGVVELADALDSSQPLLPECPLPGALESDVRTSGQLSGQPNGSLACRISGCPYVIERGRTYEWGRKLYGSFAPNGHRQYFEQSGALNKLLELLAQVCGAGRAG